MNVFTPKEDTAAIFVCKPKFGNIYVIYRSFTSVTPPKDAKLMIDLTMLRNRYDLLQHSTDTKDKVIDKLQRGNDSTIKHYMKLNNDKAEQLKQADAKITALRDLLVKENGKSHDLDVKLTEANNDIDYLKEELTATIADRDRYKLKVEATVADSRTAIDKCQAEINRLNAELVKANETTVNAEFEAADAKNKFDDATATIYALDAERTKLRADLDRMTDERNKYSELVYETVAYHNTQADLYERTAEANKKLIAEQYELKDKLAKAVAEHISQATGCAAFSTGDHSKGSDGDVDLNAYTITKCISLFKNAPTAEVILHTTIGDIVIKLAK